MQTLLTQTTLRLTFDGDLLSSNVDALRNEILAAFTQNPGAQSVVANLANCRLVDSKGINLLIALYRESEHRKLAFKVENPSADVRRLLTLLNLTARFGLTT